MIGENVILRVDGNNLHFQRTFKKLDQKIQKEARQTFGELFMLDVANAPLKLHLHPLKGFQVNSVIDQNKKTKVYTIHISREDKYKASFTLENGTAYMRVCGEHDSVDKSP